MPFKALLLALLLPLPARSQSIMSVGLDNVWAARAMTANNPPLPLLGDRPGAWKLTLQPAAYLGKPGESDFDEPSYHARGSLQGWGGAAGLSYAFSRDWGAYVWTAGARTTSEAAAGPQAGCAGCAVAFEFPQVRATSEVAGAGVLYRAVFAGVVVARTSATQTVRRRSAGTLTDDFDMELTQTLPGLALGAQAALPWGEDWELSPFALATYYFGDGCAGYRVTRQGADGGQSAFSSPGCAGSRRLRLGDQQLGLHLGLNALYKPWSLSINLSAPYFASLLAHELYRENSDVYFFSLGWHFGS